MSDLAVEGEVRRMQLICGLVSVPEVVAWAEEALGTEEYDDNLANVALATEASQPEMVSLLGELATGADRIEALRQVMGSMHSALTADPSLAPALAGALKQFETEYDGALPDDMSFISGLGDDAEQLVKALGSFV